MFKNTDERYEFYIIETVPELKDKLFEHNALRSKEAKMNTFEGRN